MNKDEFTKQVTSKLDQLAKEQHHNKMLVMNHVLDTVKRNRHLITVFGK
jgi:predicted transcriptional regulator